MDFFANRSLNRDIFNSRAVTKQDKKTNIQLTFISSSFITTVDLIMFLLHFKSRNFEQKQKYEIADTVIKSDFMIGGKITTVVVNNKTKK